MTTPYSSVDDGDDPNLGGGSTGSTPPSNVPTASGWQNIVAYSLSTTRNCRLDAIAAAKQSFSNGQQSWAAQLVIDDNVVHQCWGQATIDTLMLMGSANLTAGNHTILLRWQGHSSITLYQPRLKPFWAYK